MVLAGSGITSAQVTTVATIVLVVITAIYVVLTGFLAIAAKRSAVAAEKAAVEAKRSSAAAEQAAAAASRAADATARSAAVAEAGSDIDFDLSASVSARGIVLTLKLKSNSQFIYVFKVVLESGSIGFPQSKVLPLDPSFEVTPRDPLPHLLTRGQRIDFDIEFDLADDPAYRWLRPTSAELVCEITYGFDNNNPAATWTTPGRCESEFPSRGLAPGLEQQPPGATE